MYAQQFELREWPRQVWKHYYALPAEIWTDELLDCLGSPASGVLLLTNEGGQPGGSGGYRAPGQPANVGRLRAPRGKGSCMTDLQQSPVPLTPPDCDLRDFAFMPLDVLRLRDSDLAVKADGEAFRCAVLLWCASWHQVPAASRPDDDDVLAQLAGFGRGTKEWLRHRDGALRGWVKCGDGRLYHPVVAEKAVEAWRAKMVQRWKTECARIKKHNQRHETDLPVPDLEEWLSLGCPQGQAIGVPGTKKGVRKDNGDSPPGHPPAVPRESLSKGQGVGQGEYL
ncbi:hypothetical protein G6F68_010834 [Rhizopus microsporus]|nr:hypothetical protein G6F68_010834 [Rhizopus microsporus]